MIIIFYPEGKKNTFKYYTQIDVCLQEQPADCKRTETAVGFPQWSCNLCVCVSLVRKGAHPGVDVRRLFT